MFPSYCAQLSVLPVNPGGPCETTTLKPNIWPMLPKTRPWQITLRDTRLALLKIGDHDPIAENWRPPQHCVTVGKGDCCRRLKVAKQMRDDVTAMARLLALLLAPKTGDTWSRHSLMSWSPTILPQSEDLCCAISGRSRIARFEATRPDGGDVFSVCGHVMLSKSSVSSSCCFSFRKRSPKVYKRRKFQFVSLQSRLLRGLDCSFPWSQSRSSRTRCPSRVSSRRSQDHTTVVQSYAVISNGLNMSAISGPKAVAWFALRCHGLPHRRQVPSL